jgi:hypothetical protein
VTPLFVAMGDAAVRVADGRVEPVMIEEPQPEITEQARWLWEIMRAEAKNDNEAFGLLLAQIVVEPQSVQAMVSAPVSRLRS